MQNHVAHYNMTYHLVTLGCQMNKSDSERVRTVIERMGYTWTDQEDATGLIGILACSVRQKAIDKVYNRIHQWNRWKKDRSLLTFLTGCVLPADRKRLLKLFDLVFTMEDVPDLGNMIMQYGVVTPVNLKTRIGEIPVDTCDTSYRDEGITTESESINLTKEAKQNRKFSTTDLRPLKPDRHNVIDLGNFWKVHPAYTSDFEAFVPIQNGCDKFCTFCAVPYTRGREISRPSGEIISEIKFLLSRNYKSITLLGQNVNSYGKDMKGVEMTFPQLLSKIGELCDNSGKEVWVYFTSPHPQDMSEEVIRVVNNNKSLARQIHLPLQSGDDKILKRMNRNHSVKKYRDIIDTIHKHIPEATIFTDIIAGFTGETDEQFENTRKIMEELRFNMAYIAMYSSRPGAISSGWADDIPQDIKKKRLQILSEELKKHTSKYNHAMIGKILRVLVTSSDRKEGYLSGYTEGKIIVRFPSNDSSLIGNFANIIVTSAADFSVEGELYSVKEPEPAVK